MFMSPTHLKILVSENFNSFVVCGFSSENPRKDLPFGNRMLAVKGWKREKSASLFLCWDTGQSEASCDSHSFLGRGFQSAPASVPHVPHCGEDVLECLIVREEERDPPCSVDLYVICGWCNSLGWTLFTRKEVPADKIFV